MVSWDRPPVGVDARVWDFTTAFPAYAAPTATRGHLAASAKSPTAALNSARAFAAALISALVRGRGGGGPPLDANAARQRRRRKREEEEYRRAQLDYQTALLTYQINMSLHGGTGQRDAVSQLVAHQGRTEQQSKKRDREEFDRRMNAK